MDPELWDRQRRRLTLLLDPGRIKRGLVPNAEAGYPLVEGVPVAVRVDPAFRDAAGQPLRAGATRRYQVGPPVRARVNPTTWHLSYPAAGSSDALTVTFDRPLDHALLQRCLSINDSAGTRLPGHPSVGPYEHSWQFHPDSPWRAGPHTLIIDPRLEDLAGNSIRRVFDRDLTRAEDMPNAARPATIDFTVRG
jgi:hypothetical protein